MQPFLKDRVVATLESRFHAHVQLDTFNISAAQGLNVTGGGLRIVPYGLEKFPPVLSADQFSFHMDPGQWANADRHIQLVRVQGLHITMPPKSARQKTNWPGAAKDRKLSSLPRLFVDRILAKDAQLTVLTDNPAKPPLQFDIHSLQLDADGRAGGMHYIASLRNPKPVGEIHATGNFGPWDADQPRATPVTGDYAFDHADLSTINGIGGILSSTGHFAGPLDHLTVDGETRTPDFRLSEAEHAMPLRTTFHAIVDGTTGDTYLQPVQAHLRNTWFTCTGSVVRVQQDGQGTGHHILLDVDLPRGRIEDLLWLAGKSAPPVMTGNVRLRAAMDIVPDPTRKLTVAKRMTLKGTVAITQAHFTDVGTDRKVDAISLRTQGRAQDAQKLQGQTGPDDLDLDGTIHASFLLHHDLLSVSSATFELPGVHAEFKGMYSLEGRQFDFSGDAKLQATVSQMFTGWKSLLLKPVDPFFKKNGAGTYIPFRISGTKDSPRFAIQFGKY